MNPDQVLLKCIQMWLGSARQRPGYPIIAQKLKSVVDDLTGDKDGDLRQRPQGQPQGPPQGLAGLLGGQ